jgi:hypothetical protein
MTCSDIYSYLTYQIWHTNHSFPSGQTKVELQFCMDRDRYPTPAYRPHHHGPNILHSPDPHQGSTICRCRLYVEHNRFYVRFRESSHQGSVIYFLSASRLFFHSLCWSSVIRIKPVRKPPTIITQMATPRASTRMECLHQ